MTYAYTPKNSWKIFENQENEIEDIARRYMGFLTTCKTERETASYVYTRLKQAGYGDSGDKIVRILHDKAVFVLRKGQKPLTEGIRLICAHSDSPRLDFKQRPLQEQCNLGQAKTHYYGGIRKYQWFARPLALHGVVVKENGDIITIVLGEDINEPVFSISDLLPHLAQSQSDVPLAKAFDAEKMNIILAHKPLTPCDEKEDAKDASSIKTRILELLYDKYGIVEEDLYSAEIQAVPAGPAREVGLDCSLIGGYGQDDRICVFTALEALLAQDAETPLHAQCLLFADKEEIGSEGSTGAKSRFFEYCVHDAILEWEPKSRFSSVMLASKAISADVHAAIDPDWQDLHEKQNSALIGNGPSFSKFTGHRGKYEANDAHPEYVAWLRQLLNKDNIPWQMSALGKVDGGGGGTVAMYFASYGMDIIDCGPAILSMHSPFELASKADLFATILVFKAFLAS